METIFPDTAPPGAATPQLLIACADTPLAHHLTALLQGGRHRVEVVGNGKDALDRVQLRNPPDICLLDMDLPGHSGVEVVWEARRRHGRGRSWLILVSRLASRDRLRAALEAGCDDFLLIPADPEELKLRIRVAEQILALHLQIQRQSAELRYRSTHDGLTGLWNREALLSLVFQETDRVQRMKTPLSLLLLDLDDFSRINHEYGYEAGDRMLTELANRFRRQLRSYDLIGRCGEDEFLLALPGCSRENAMAMADRIRELILAKPFAANGDATTLTASFGIAASSGRSPLVVLREAERALAEAKLAGKNCARCFASSAGLGLELTALVS